LQLTAVFSLVAGSTDGAAARRRRPRSKIQGGKLHMPILIDPKSHRVHKVPNIQISIEIDPVTNEQKIKTPAGWGPADTALVLNQVCVGLLAEDKKQRMMLIDPNKPTSTAKEGGEADVQTN
jgi:hypothetical protein